MMNSLFPEEGCVKGARIIWRVCLVVLKEIGRVSYVLLWNDEQSEESPLFQPKAVQLSS